MECSAVMTKAEWRTLALVATVVAVGWTAAYLAVHVFGSHGHRQYHHWKGDTSWHWHGNLEQRNAAHTAALLTTATVAHSIAASSARNHTT